MSQITKSMWKYSDLWFLHLLKEYSNLTFITGVLLSNEYINPSSSDVHVFHRCANDCELFKVSSCSHDWFIWQTVVTWSLPNIWPTQRSTRPLLASRGDRIWSFSFDSCHINDSLGGNGRVTEIPSNLIWSIPLCCINILY